MSATDYMILTLCILSVVAVFSGIALHRAACQRYEEIRVVLQWMVKKLREDGANDGDGQY